MTDIGNQMRGHKANLANPNTSEESKERSRRFLDEAEAEVGYDPGESMIDTGGKNVGNIAGGHKANLKNPRTSEESKEHSQQVLENLVDTGEKDVENVARGHKANLKNPRTSEESKERSQQILEDIEGGE